MKFISIIFIVLLVQGFAFAQPDLYLYSQLPQHDTLVPGQALVLKVQISDPDIENNNINQQADAAYLEELKKALENKEISDTIFKEEQALLLGRETSNYTVGTEAKPWFDQMIWQYFDNGNWQNYPFQISYLEGLAVPSQLDMNTLSRTEAPFGIDPGQTGKMTASEYKFRVGMLSSNISKPIEQDTIWSNHLNLKTIPAKGLYPEWSVLEKQYDLIFWYFKTEYDRVISLADGLIASDTTDILSITYKADALAAKGQFEEAAIWFDKGIEAYDAKFPDAYEPPAYLIERYNEIIGILLEN